ncbi:hypothetical protein [Halostagnicola bangensis]
MPLTQRSLPREELPPNWGPVETSDDRISYRHSRSSATLFAARVSAHSSHPSLGLSRCWEIRYRYSVGECSATERLGSVTTRSAALDALLECMHHVYDSVDSSDSPLDIRAALESVSLSALIPEDSSALS